MSRILVGEKAPPFTLPDVNGNQHSLREALEHGPVVVAFFKISCPVCQFTFPFLERLYRHYATSQVTFWGISQDDAGDTAAFSQEFGVSFPLLLDDERSYTVSNAYGLTNVPTFFFIASDGTVRIRSVGFGKAELEEIDAQLAAQSKRAKAPVFGPQDVVPNHKPG
jgi:peroxiredoxin